MEVRPKVHTRMCHPQLELSHVDEPQWGKASDEFVRMRRKPNVDALQPRRSGESIGRGKETCMAPV